MKLVKISVIDHKINFISFQVYYYFKIQNFSFANNHDDDDDHHHHGKQKLK